MSIPISEYNIKVSSDDVVLIMTTDLETQLLLPTNLKLAENDPNLIIADNIAIMTAITTKLVQDPSFVNNLMDWLEHFEEMHSNELMDNQRWN